MDWDWRKMKVLAVRVDHSKNKDPETRGTMPV